MHTISSLVWALLEGIKAIYVVFFVSFLCMLLFPLLCTMTATERSDKLTFLIWSYLIEQQISRAY